MSIAGVSLAMWTFPVVVAALKGPPAYTHDKAEAHSIYSPYQTLSKRSVYVKALTSVTARASWCAFILSCTWRLERWLITAASMADLGFEPRSPWISWCSQSRYSVTSVLLEFPGSCFYQGPRSDDLGQTSPVAGSRKACLGNHLSHVDIPS